MEGPGILNIRNRLSFLIGSIVIKTFGNTKIEKEILIGRKLTDINSVGKRLYIYFEDKVLSVHFLMYGSFSLNKSKEDKKVRLGLEFESPKFGKNFLYFYNTSLKLLNRGETFLDHTVDVLSDQFDKKKAFEAISEDERVISDVLLDQKIFAGVGNIIKNEALFLAKIHPESVSQKIPKEKINELLNQVLVFSKAFFDQRKRGEGLKKILTVYSRKECFFCGNRLKIKWVGTTRRKTYYCENCQKLYA